jgi:ABC-2 type transport system ATP-binding protein
VLLVALTAASTASARDGVITSFDGTRIVYSFFPAGSGKAPTVMMGPGYSMSRAGADDAYVKALLAAGYNVLTWDPRGFGDSGGNVEVDSPDYEAKDASALIDLIAKQPEATLDAPGDPRLGMFGASYGGGIEWVTAATDTRVDVIAPSISWNSLITSLDKNDTAKGGWGSLLFGLGIEGSTVSGVTGGSQPNGFQFGRMQDPATQQAFADGVATGSFTAQDKAFFAARGPELLLSRVKVPTLITQGTSDTLFTLQESIANYAAMKKNGVPLKMVWFCGSLSNASGGDDVVHGQCNSDPGPDKMRVIHSSLTWLNRYLKGDKTVDTGPAFEWVSQDGQTHGAADYPAPQGAPLTFEGKGRLPLVPGDTSGALIAAAPAANAVNVAFKAVTSSTQLVGTPTMTLEYSGQAPQADGRIYAQIVDTTKNQVVGPMVTPIPVTLDGAKHALTIPIEAIALTVAPADKYALQLTDGSSVYFAQRQAGQVTFDRIALSIPTVSAAAAKANTAARSCVDKRKFHFTIHQLNGRVVAVRAYVGTHRVQSLRGHRIRSLTLSRLPLGRYRVKIVTTTAHGAHATSVRSYRGCYKTKPKTVVTPRKKRRR